MKKTILSHWPTATALSALILIPNFCSAQSPLASLNFDTVVVNHQRTCEVVVELTDTLFSAVEVGLGSSRNQTDLFFLEIPADPSQGLPSGITLSRDGYRLTLGIGWLPVKDYYYGQLRIKNASGVWSSLYKFFQN